MRVAAEREFIWPVRIYYEDTDAGGVVFYANYLKYMERARTEWLRALGYEQDMLQAEGTAFVVRKADIDYLRPARFNDLLEVVSRIVAVRGASITFSQIVRCLDQHLVEASIKIVCVDMRSFRPKPIPALIKEDFLRVS